MSSKFGNTLNVILAEKRLKQVDLAKKTGVAHSIISRAIKNGTGLSNKNYRSIIENVGNEEQKEILIAALLKDFTLELGGDPNKCKYPISEYVYDLEPELLPLFHEISQLQKNNPRLTKVLGKLALIARTAEDEFDAVISKLSD